MTEAAAGCGTSTRAGFFIKRQPDWCAGVLVQRLKLVWTAAQHSNYDSFGLCTCVYVHVSSSSSYFL